MSEYIEEGEYRTGRNCNEFDIETSFDEATGTYKVTTGIADMVDRYIRAVEKAAEENALDALEPLLNKHGWHKAEIIHCRDCKKSEKSGDRLFCHKFSMSDRAGYPVEPYGYCFWAERRAD